MKFEGVRRTIVVTLIITLLSAGVVSPRPARAIDTAILVIGSIAAYAAFVVTGAWLMRRNSPSSWELMPMDPERRDERAERGLRLAPGCKQDSTNLTLACW